MPSNSTSAIHDRLRRGFAAHQAGDLAAAQAAYLEVLGQLPDEPDALQLLGLLAKGRGDLAEAERCWRRSLAARPAQPHVLNNLANLLLKTGRVAAAEACLEQALQLKPDYGDASLNLALVRHERGDNDGAVEALRNAMASTPQPTAAMRQLQAELLADDAQLEAALAVLDAAVAEFPAHAALHHNRGVVLHRLGRHADSLAAHDAARACGLDDADGHYNRGNTLQSLGRLGEAVEAYRTALRRQPAHRLALYDLARLRWRLGDDDFDAELRAARDHAGADPQPALVHGHLLWAAGRFATAATAFDEAQRIAPGAEALDGWARCCVRAGDLERGLQAHARAVALDPARAQLRVNHAASLLVAGQARDAADEAQAALALDPAHQHAVALLGIAWRALGEDARERWLNDYERFISVHDLGGETAPWLAPLVAYLEAQHGDVRAPIEQTLRHGTQSFGNLFDCDEPSLARLRPLIDAAVAAYVAALPEDPSHPFLRRRSARWRIAGSWSSRLGRSGFHIDHIHPFGWISAALYLRVPGRCLDASLREGWLRFGQPDFDVSRLGLGDGVRRMVEPRAGSLVLFPSMMWHGTTPFQSDEERLTISFDVVPLAD